MRTMLLSIVVVMLLAACSAGGPGGGNELGIKALENLQHCQREYVVGIGVGATGSLRISCPPMPYPDQPQAPTAPAAALNPKEKR